VTKADVIEELKKQLQDKITVMKSALADSEESATGDETKSEGKYDTRAVEASYLAQAQDEQIVLAEEGLASFERFDPPAYDTFDEIGPGALVETEADDEISFYLLAPAGGGLTTKFLGCELTVITPDSRLYQEMVDQKMGDSLTSPPLMITGVE